MVPAPRNAVRIINSDENIVSLVMSIFDSWRKLLLALVLVVVFLSGCRYRDDFKLTDMAKTDIDKISEIHLDLSTRLMKELTEKLYKKNPGELQKNENETIDTRIRKIFECPAVSLYEEVDSKKGPDAILLGFDPEYRGDRVFAVMYGLYTMVLKSYNDKCELFIPDYLDEQHLYNSARNIEILVWRLNTRLNPDGSPLLLTNSIDALSPNLSFERLFGKLISLQDTMAVIISGRTNRMIREVVLIAGMTFLPVGF